MGIGTQVVKVGGDGYAMIQKLGFKSSGSSKLLINLGITSHIVNMTSSTHSTEHDDLRIKDPHIHRPVVSIVLPLLNC